MHNDTLVKNVGLIPDEHKTRIKEKLQKELKDSVRIIVFTQEVECEFCREARALMQEISSLVPDKILVEIYDLVKDQKKAEEFKIDKVPAIAIVGKNDYGIRYYGIPYGYEFNAFIENVVNVANGTTNLPEDTKK